MNTQRKHTSGFIHYLPETEQALNSDRLARLTAAAAVEPILKRWRHRCPEGLIDESGKIRNIFTRQQGTDNVTAVIEALKPITEATREFEAALAAQRELNALSRNPVETEIHNARLLTDASLDGCGFQLEHHISAVSDWQDDAQVTGIYYDEINALVKAITGATHAFSNNHLRRESEPEHGGNGPLAELMAQSRGPVLTAHNDFAESFGDGIAKTIASNGVPHTQTFGMTEAMLEAGITAADLEQSRMLVINTWRSVAPGPLRRFPLAIADRRTVEPSCLRASRIGRIPSGEPRGGIDLYTARHEPGIKWYYYPEMRPDEVLLWKGYDSAEVPMQPTLHTSFDDADTPADAAERMSVEVRVLCLLPRR